MLKHKNKMIALPFILSRSNTLRGSQHTTKHMIRAATNLVTCFLTRIVRFPVLVAIFSSELRSIFTIMQ